MLALAFDVEMTRPFFAGRAAGAGVVRLRSAPVALRVFRGDTGMVIMCEFQAWEFCLFSVGHVINSPSMLGPKISTWKLERTAQTVRVPNGKHRITPLDKPPRFFPKNEETTEGYREP